MVRAIWSSPQQQLVKKGRKIIMEIEITLHDGTKKQAFIKDYTPESFASLINDRSTEMLVFGNGGIVKHAIKTFEPTDLIK